MSISSVGQPLKSVPALFRDCLRLVNHVAGKNGAKSVNIKRIVRGEFSKNKEVSDAATIDALRGNAVRALSNYLMLSSLSKDKTFKEGANAFNSRELDLAHATLEEAEFEAAEPVATAK